VNVGIKVLNTEMKETKNCHTGELTKHKCIFFP